MHVDRRSGPEVLVLAESLRRRLGIAIAGRAARGELARQTLEEQPGDPSGGEPAGGDVEVHALNRKLHDALFSRLLPHVPEQEPIAVVPYRELGAISFALLAGADGRPIVECHPLSVLPSLASLGALAQPVERGPGRAVIVGGPLLPAKTDLDPLPDAPWEAMQVDKALRRAGVKTKSLPGPSATEASFRKHINGCRGCRVVHVACHASLCEPVSQSALFLTPSARDDGLLTPAESLDAALVVLSPCQRGLGRVTADGVLGLGRAFMRAGARAVVASLWRVADGVTADLMRDFYEALVGDGFHQPLDVAAAARRAQGEVRARVPDASAWEPWLVVGDGGWRLR
jgi:CHAT domain-containing protein